MTGDNSIQNIVQEITIPAFMISQGDGDKLRRLLTEVDVEVLESLCQNFVPSLVEESANEHVEDTTLHFETDSEDWPQVKLRVDRLASNKESGLQFVIKLAANAPAVESFVERLGSNAFILGEDLLVKEDLDDSKPALPNKKSISVNVLMEATRESSQLISIKKTEVKLVT